MKVLIVSDTHGKDENLEETVLRETPFDYFIHCGDVEGREIFMEALVECPCTIVSGNNDFFSDLPREVMIQLEGHRILVTHGHYYGVSMGLYGVLDEGKARECQVVLFGHTHRPVEETEEGILLLNPGSLSYPRPGRTKAKLRSNGTAAGEGTGGRDQISLNKQKNRRQ